MTTVPAAATGRSPSTPRGIAADCPPSRSDSVGMADPGQVVENDCGPTQRMRRPA